MFGLRDDTEANPHSVPQPVSGQAYHTQANMWGNTAGGDILQEVPDPTVSLAGGCAAQSGAERFREQALHPVVRTGSCCWYRQ